MILWKKFHIMELFIGYRTMISLRSCCQGAVSQRKDVEEMFVLYNENTRFPVKIWLEDESRLEESCLEQA